MEGRFGGSGFEIRGGDPRFSVVGVGEGIRSGLVRAIVGHAVGGG